MRTSVRPHPWMLMEETWQPQTLSAGESLMTLGNAHLRIRGTFEEDCTGGGTPTAHIAGLFRDIPRHSGAANERAGNPAMQPVNVGNLLALGVTVNDVAIDLGDLPVTAYCRALDMEHGLLTRTATLACPAGPVHIEAERFVSIVRPRLLALRYRVTPSFDATIAFTPALDLRTRVTGQAFWQELLGTEDGGFACVEGITAVRKMISCLTAAMWISHDGPLSASRGRVSRHVVQRLQAGETAELEKLVAVDAKSDATDTSNAVYRSVLSALETAQRKGYKALRAEQSAAWRARWDDMDVCVDSDPALQQGIRYSLFSLGGIYWASDKKETALPVMPADWREELFCLPTIYAAFGERAGNALLMRRFRQLKSAMENARAAGCAGALYPAQTYAGEESEPSSREALLAIHRNAAVFYGFFWAHAYTGDDHFLRTKGLPVMLEICRYWVSRVTWNEKRRAYTLLSVNGPNGYEENVQNNWYTNRMVKFCLEQLAEYARVKIGLPALKPYGATEREIARFERIARKMYLPSDKKMNIAVQHSGYMDKELRDVDTLSPADMPLCKQWTLDRRLRSCFLQQADVLLAFFALPHLHGGESLASNYAFYAPKTVHEAPHSFGVHAVLAAALQRHDESMTLLRLTARLDLDDRLGDTANGLHPTAMGVTWLVLLRGILGVTVEEGVLQLRPSVPWALRSFCFRMKIQGRVLRFEIGQGELIMTLQEGPPLMVQVYDSWIWLRPGLITRAIIRFAQKDPASPSTPSAAAEQQKGEPEHAMDSDI